MTSIPSPAPSTFPDLDGKVVLITGGSTGIGAAVAAAMARNGAKVAINFKSSRAEAETVAAGIEEAGGKAVLIQADVTERGAAAQVIGETVAALGRIDILINNAGALNTRKMTTESDDAYIEHLIALNATQVVRFVREGVAQFRRQGGGGSIINVSSVAARSGGGGGSVVYAGAKGFVSTVTRGWAKEFVKDNIRVNAVAPGLILTPFHERASSAQQLASAKGGIPMDRFGVPEDCVGAFLFLASESLSGYMTGQIIEVNGGQVMP